MYIFINGYFNFLCILQQQCYSFSLLIIPFFNPYTFRIVSEDILQMLHRTQAIAQLRNQLSNRKTYEKHIASQKQNVNKCSNILYILNQQLKERICRRVSEESKCRSTIQIYLHNLWNNPKNFLDMTVVIRSRYRDLELYEIVS